MVMCYWQSSVCFNMLVKLRIMVGRICSMHWETINGLEILVGIHTVCKNVDGCRIGDEL
jgi:hypothetical protein